MLKNKHYPSLVYIGIIITLLAITFNLMDILQKSNYKITGYSIYKKADIKSNYKLYSKESLKKTSETNLPSFIYNTITILTFFLLSLGIIKFIYSNQIRI